MLVEVTLDEKALDDLSEVEKERKALGKFTDDAGDVTTFRSKSDPNKKYLRVWVTIPPRAANGPATYKQIFYEVRPLTETSARKTPLNTK